MLTDLAYRKLLREEGPGVGGVSEACGRWRCCHAKRLEKSSEGEEVGRGVGE